MVTGTNQAGSGTGAPTAARREPLGWHGLVGICLGVLAVVLIGRHFQTQADLRARLMRAEPGSIARDGELRSFALSVARPIYDGRCAGCHGNQMQGDRARGVPSFSGKKWLYGEGRVSEIERTILYGIRSGNSKAWNLADMPGFGLPVPYKRYQIPSLEPGEIRDVIEYVLMAGKQPGDKEAAARGQKIFADKGQCFDCHSGDAQGDAAIGAPGLIDGNWLYGNGTREDLFDTIARGRSGICPAFVQQLSPVTIRALAVLIYTNSHKAPAKTAAASPGTMAGTGG
jgi:cbb3-type cytochrome c oxidase subunit III